MPYYEARKCEDCGYEWDDIDLTEIVTVGTFDHEDDSTYSLYTCPSCYLRLLVQRVADGNSWRHWCRALPPVPTDTSGELVARVAGRITEVLAAGRTIYRPVAISLGEVECVRCGVSLATGPLDRPAPACPECRGPRSVFNGDWGFVTFLCDPSPECGA